MDDLQTVAATEAAWGDDLRAEVDRVFVRTGADTPGGPTTITSPLDEEYSRVTDVGKYHASSTHASTPGSRCWQNAASPPPPTCLPSRGSAGADRPGPPPRTPPDAIGARVLSFLSRPPWSAALLGLDVGMTDGDQDPVLLAMVPDCGCDACDSGSADLLVEARRVDPHRGTRRRRPRPS
ncbi:MAG: DUF6226 family protein [Nocardioidaceae bacterium]